MACEIDETFVPKFDEERLDEAQDAFFDWLKKVGVLEADDQYHVFGDAGMMWFHHVVDDDTGVFYSSDTNMFGYFKKSENTLKEDESSVSDEAKAVLTKWLWNRAKISLSISPDTGTLVFMSLKMKDPNVFECYIVRRMKSFRLTSGKCYYDMVPLLGPIKHNFADLVI